MSTHSNEPSPDSIVQDLHAIREQIVAEFGGDLAKLTAAARQRQESSGRKIIRKGVAEEALHRAEDQQADQGPRV